MQVSLSFFVERIQVPSELFCHSVSVGSPQQAYGTAEKNITYIFPPEIKVYYKMDYYDF